MSHLKKMWLSINHSITRTYSRIRSTDRQFRNGTKNEIYKQESFYTADRYINHFNISLPTLSQSISFKFRGPTSHAPESNAELMISPRKVIRSMLAPIPLIQKKNSYVISLCLFLSLRTWNTVTHSKDLSAVLPHLLFAKDRIQQEFSVQHNFSSHFLVPNFMFTLPGSRNVSSQCTDTVWCKVRTKVPSIFWFTFPLLCCICWFVTENECVPTWAVTVWERFINYWIKVCYILRVNSPYSIAYYILKFTSPYSIAYYILKVTSPYPIQVV